MDNDVPGTEYCIGFSTAITRAQRSDQPAADDARVARADRRVPDLRPRRRVLRAVRRLRHVGALRDPRAPYDLERLAAILAEDHRSNPSHYALVLTAEGAIWEGRPHQDVGEADTFGHRHKANVGEALATELKARTGIETRRLGADLRPPVRRARLARLDGRDDVRERRDGPRPGRDHGPDGRDPGRQVRPYELPQPRARRRGGSTSPTCTTWSGSGRATRASWATRCSSSGCQWGRDGLVRGAGKRREALHDEGVVLELRAVAGGPRARPASPARGEA